MNLSLSEFDTICPQTLEMNGYNLFNTIKLNVFDV